MSAPQAVGLCWDSLGGPTPLSSRILYSWEAHKDIFPPLGFPDPCLPGTNLHCSMNYTSWLMGAQYGWKFLKTRYQRSWEGACISCAPFCRTTGDLAILRVWAAGGLRCVRLASVLHNAR